MTKESFNNDIGSIINNSNVSSTMLDTEKATREMNAMITPTAVNAVKMAKEMNAMITPAAVNAVKMAKEMNAMITPGTLEKVTTLIRQTDLLNNIRLSESFAQAISEVDINELQLYWEDEKVQEVIDEGLSVVGQENDQLSIMQLLNNWAAKVLDFPSSLREKSPFVFLTLTFVMSLISLTVIPAVQDIIKEKLWHVSDFLEEKKDNEAKEKPKTQVKELKANVLLEYPEAENAMNYVRITNRETPVYRSEKRKSGKIDTIKSNKPAIIIYKKRNWSLVMYRNSSNEEVNGWVFTKNLTK
ncbi:hypothetical protein [Priestia aryabhattai]|uniref:hypothetical protein n=1 Tax=Priestia aryabhattai TaxID=412384 RepID=UPI003D265503